jgi:hypothetical protein
VWLCKLKIIRDVLRNYFIVIVVLLFFIVSSEYGRVAFNLHENFSTNGWSNLLGIQAVRLPGSLMIDVFMIVLGFLMYTIKFRVQTAGKVWIQYILYSLGIFFLAAAFGVQAVTKMDLISAIFPVTNQIWPFGSALFVTILFVPLLKKFVDLIEREKQGQVISVVLVVLVFVLPFLYGWGHNIPHIPSIIIRLLDVIVLFVLGMFTHKFSWHKTYDKKFFYPLGIFFVALFFASNKIVSSLKHLPFNVQNFEEITGVTNTSYSIVALIAAAFIAVILLRHFYLDKMSDLFKKYITSILGVYLFTAHPDVSRFVISRVLPHSDSNLGAAFHLVLLVITMMLISVIIENNIAQGFMPLWHNEKNRLSVNLVTFFVVILNAGILRFATAGGSAKLFATWAGQSFWMNFLNLVLMTAIFLIILTLTNRIWVTSLIFTLVFVFIDVANVIKMKTAKAPLLLSDLNGDLFKHIGGNYGLVLAGLAVALIVLFVLLQKKSLTGAIWSLKMRAVVFVLSLIFSVGFITALNAYSVDEFAEEGNEASVTEKLLHAANYQPLKKDLRFNATRNGFLVNFTTHFEN